LPFISKNNEVAPRVFHQELWNFSVPQSCSMTFFHHFEEVLNSI